MNTKLDLIWIIPEIIGELVIYVGFPIYLIINMVEFGILSYNGIMSISVALLLLKNIELKGFDELKKIKGG